MSGTSSSSSTTTPATTASGPGKKCHGADKEDDRTTKNATTSTTTTTANNNSGGIHGSSSGAALLLLDLETCSARDLAVHLLQLERFKNQQNGTVSAFLTQAAAAAVGATTSAAADNGGVGEAAAAVAPQGVGDAVLVSATMMEPLIQDVTISCLAPRGKFNMTFGKPSTSTPGSGGGGMHALATSKSIPSWFIATNNEEEDEVATSAAANVVVERAIFFPKPQDCRSTSVKTKKASSTTATTAPVTFSTTDMVLLVLKKPGLMFKNKRLKQLCFPLPNTLPQNIHDEDKPDDVVLDNSCSENEGADDYDDKEDATTKVVVDHTAAWIKVLATSLGLSNSNQIVRVWNPNNRKKQQQSSSWCFQSHQPSGTSTTTGGLPFLPCYHGVNDGHLYPLAEGLLFFKPALFVPRSRMQRLDCGRGASSGNSRYVDLVVALHPDENENDNDGNDDDDEDSNGSENNGDRKKKKTKRASSTSSSGSSNTLEFTNLNRSELEVLEKYIHRVLIPAMKRDASNNNDTNHNDGDEGGNSPTNNTSNKNNAANDTDETQDEQEQDDASNSDSNRGRRSTGKRKASIEAREINKRMRDDDNEEDEEDEDDLPEHRQDDDDDDDFDEDAQEDSDETESDDDE